MSCFRVYGPAVEQVTEIVSAWESGSHFTLRSSHKLNAVSCCVLSNIMCVFQVGNQSITNRMLLALPLTPEVFIFFLQGCGKESLHHMTVHSGVI